jgi:hypothetical protein
MNGYKEFSIGLTRVVQNIILPIPETDRIGMRTSLSNLLYDKDEPVKFMEEYNSEDRAPIELFHVMFEIETSVQNLLDTEIYIRRFPFTKTRVTKVRYLRYVFVNYLSEVYLLKQRLKSFLKLVDDLYANGNKRKEVRKVTQPLFQLVAMAFENIVTARSLHVHKEIYSDKQLDKLGILESISKHDKENENQFSWLGYFGWQYREIRSQKTKQIKEMNQEIERVLDHFFSKLHPIVFDDEMNVVRV